MFWVSILILSLFAHSLVSIIQASIFIDHRHTFTLSSFEVMFWISSFFRALTFIVVIVIAKNITWGLDTLAVPGVSGERQYGAYNHQQDPVSGGAGRRA